MHEIGRKTAEKLHSIHIYTIGDIAQVNDVRLKNLLGINGLRLKERANGIEWRPVDPEAIFDYKSIGNSTTLPRDSANQKELTGILETLAGKVAARLKNKNLLGQKISVTIRYGDCKTITRSQLVDNPFSDCGEIYRLVTDLFLKNWNGEGVRLLGVTAFDVIEKDVATKQLDLFSYEVEAEKERLYKAMEQLQNKYGKNIIKKGLPVHNSTVIADTSFSKDFLD